MLKRFWIMAINNILSQLFEYILNLPQYTFSNNNTSHGEQRWTVLIRQLLHTYQWQHATQWATRNCFNQPIVHCANSWKQSIKQSTHYLQWLCCWWNNLLNILLFWYAELKCNRLMAELDDELEINDTGLLLPFSGLGLSQNQNNTFNMQAR